MDANVKNDEFAKLSMMDRISYGLGDFAQNLIFGTVGGFLLFYLTTVDGLSSATGAIIFTIVRWVNVFWDPWVGTTVDRRTQRVASTYHTSETSVSHWLSWLQCYSCHLDNGSQHLRCHMPSCHTWQRL